ncbi:MAG: adenylate/guanylate cyclase domain-containing protein [Chloroflexota bacterium]
MAEPRIQYVTTSDGVNIAYADMSEGYPTIYLSGMPWNHIQQQWKLPPYRSWFEGSFLRRRLILYDARGSGLSDRGIKEYSLSGFRQDIDAIANKLGLERFVLAGVQAGSMIAVDYAFHNPERVSHLFIWDAVHDGKEFMALPQVKAFFSMVEYDWDMFVATIARTIGGWDTQNPQPFEEFVREAVLQEDALRFYFDFLANATVTPLLPDVKQPALVAHHRGNMIPPPDSGRFMASRLGNAEFLLLNGTWHDNQSNLPVINEAMDRLLRDEAPPRPAPSPIAEPAQRPAPAGGLVTILFTDIEGSTALTQRLGDVKAREVFRGHEQITRDALRQFGGSEVKSMGDGFMASFISATQALECAIAMERAFAAHNENSNTPLNVRIGLNTGEPIAEEQDLFGTAVITAARIAAKANGGEILASNVVRELVAGRGFAFADRGEMALRGFDDPVRVYELRWRE